MAKLFSFEDQDLAQAGTDVELDSSAEEGAAAQVTQEMTEDHQEIAGMDESVQDATMAAGQLEEVQAGVQATVDNGEGLTQVAAEGYRFAVESIALMVGAPKKSVYALYSTENFASTSSRMANTRISLEGIGEFLKNLWERIKAAVKSVIEKVKAFYAKHLSGMGRVTKALEAMKAKVATSKGTIQNNRVKSPGSLKSAFPTSTTLKASDIEKYVERHQKHSEPFKGKKFDEVIGVVTKIKEAFTGTISSWKDDVINEMKLVYAKDRTDVTEADPLVSGVWYKTETSDSDLSLWKESVEKVELKSADDSEASIASKSELKKIVESTIKVISATKDFDKGVKAFSEKFNSLSKEIDNAYNGKEDGNKARQKEGSGASDDAKTNSSANMEELKKALAAVGKIGSSVPAKSASLAALNVKLGFAVVSYCKFNLAQYK